MIIDCSFNLHGGAVPLDHGYALFGAVSRVLHQLHERPCWGVHPVVGTRVAPGVLALTPRSSLTIRAPADDIAELLPLAGKKLELDGHRVVVGTPTVHPLRPAHALRSRFVTIKGADAGDATLHELGRRALARLAVECADLSKARLRIGERRVMRVSNHTVVGFAADIELTAEASLFIQEKGLGGRRHMGAGLFIPAGN